MNTWIICKKELKSYFASPIAYAMLTFFALIFGFFFFAATQYFVERSTDPMMAMRGNFPMDMNEFIVRPVLMNVAVIALFVVPMITMRLFAEEKKTGTIELLATSPVRDIEIILGKWLGALILFAGALVVSFLDMTLLFIYGKPDWKPLLVGYLGLLLLGGALLAIGTFISSTTRNQIIAGGATFAVCLLLWVIEWVAGRDTSVTTEVLRTLSITSHLEGFAKGVIDTKDLVYYVSVIFLGLFLTARSMESLRWRA